jgi:hypothetical protein
MGIRNQVLLRLGYETMRRRSELCAFKFEDIDCAPNGKPIIRLNFSKTDQYGTGKVLPISEELLNLLEKWKEIVGDEGYILRSINKHGHIGDSLNPASISTILKTLQEGLKSGSNQQPLSGHSFRVGAALDLLEQGEPLEKIMLRGGWQTDSTAMKYLRNWTTNLITYNTLSHLVPPLYASMVFRKLFPYSLNTQAVLMIMCLHPEELNCQLALELSFSIRTLLGLALIVSLYKEFLRYHQKHSLSTYGLTNIPVDRKFQKYF